MSYRAYLTVDIIMRGKRFYAALRKNRARCSICHHLHGPNRNRAPEVCRASGCGCRHMIDDVTWVDPPWVSPAAYRAAHPTLPRRAKRDAP